MSLDYVLVFQCRVQNDSHISRKVPSCKDLEVTLGRWSVRTLHLSLQTWRMCWGIQHFMPASRPKDRVKTNSISDLCKTLVCCCRTKERKRKKLLPLTQESWDLGRCSLCIHQLASQTSTWNINKSNQSCLVLTGRRIYVVSHRS